MQQTSLGKQRPSLAVPSCLQADAGAPAPLGVICGCLLRLVPYAQRSDPAPGGRAGVAAVRAVGQGAL